MPLIRVNLDASLNANSAAAACTQIHQILANYGITVSILQIVSVDDDPEIEEPEDDCEDEDDLYS